MNMQIKSVRVTGGQRESTIVNAAQLGWTWVNLGHTTQVSIGCESTRVDVSHHEPFRHALK